MVKELKSLCYLGSFNVVARPRGANILIPTWGFNKKRYIDIALKKYKTQIYVWRDQQIGVLDDFKIYLQVAALVNPYPSYAATTWTI